MILCVYLYTHIIGDFFLPSIEVPGIGYIDANGFAEEQTMQRILAAIQGQDSGGGGGAGMGTLATGANKAGSALAGVASSGRSASAGLDDATRGISRSGQEIAIAQQRYARSLSDIQGITRAAAQGPLDVIENMMGGLKRFTFGTDQSGKATKGAESALKKFGKGAMKVVEFLGGTMLGDLNQMGQQYREAQQAGALLGGDMVAFRVAAQTAGLSMKEFNAILKTQGADFARFAGQTRIGALEFMRQNADLIATQGKDLLRLGLDFQDMGSYTAEFLGELTLAGQSIDNFRYDTNSISTAIRQQVVQQKALAAINGTTLEQERQKQRAARQDMVLRAGMQGLNAENQKHITNLIAEFPQIGTAIKEIAVLGGVTTQAGSMQMMANQGLMDTIGPLVSQLGVAGGNVAYMGNAVLDAQKAIAANPAAIARDRELASESAVLLIAGAQNKFLGGMEQSINQGFEYQQKVISGVVDNVLNELNEPLTNFRNTAGGTTTTLNNLDIALRDLQNRTAGLFTAAYGTDIAPALLQSLGNVTIGTARAGLAGAEGGLSAMGFSPRPGSEALGIPGAQNTPVPAGSAFSNTDLFQGGGALDYLLGGAATELKNSMSDSISGLGTKMDAQLQAQKETTEAVNKNTSATNNMVSAMNKNTTAVNNS